MNVGVDDDSVDAEVGVAEHVIGLLHPGEMGAAVGACLTGQGHTVWWASNGRGPATASRAGGAGLSDAGSVAEVAARSDVILSVCPPHAALDMARSVADAGGFHGVFADANAISPATSRDVAAIVAASGASYVDGGIIGLPPGTSAGGTRLYLCGPDAPLIQDLFAGTALDARLVDGDIGAASAVKMAYASWTKGSSALLLAARALARAENVEDTLLDEWRLSQPAAIDRVPGAARSATAKGWRWVAEMQEIADSMAAAGLPRGFHDAAAEIYSRPARGLTDTPGHSVTDAVLDALRTQPKDD
jgi:3-hydroxyisobutyrate dehydrogenase-like beta-hydroxyacid dehydrogenase